MAEVADMKLWRVVIERQTTAECFVLAVTREKAAAVANENELEALDGAFPDVATFADLKPLGSVPEGAGKEIVYVATDIKLDPDAPETLADWFSFLANGGGSAIPFAEQQAIAEAAGQQRLLP